MSESPSLLPLPDTPAGRAVRQIAEMIRNRGGRALLAGGGVRDLLSGRPLTDFDLEVYGLDAETLQKTVSAEFSIDTVGMSFGVIKVRHLPIDIALPRRENKTGKGHRGFMITTVPDLSFAEAAARRDFTVNAIMCDPLTGEIIDPHNGRTDLQNQILRHVSEHFSEDPLRVLRGMQFIARFGFTPAPETVQLCRELSQAELAPERIGTEWDKFLLQGTHQVQAIAFLRDSGWLRFYPELAALPGYFLDAVADALEHAASHRTGKDADDRCIAAAILCRYLTEEEAASLLAGIWRRNDLQKSAVALAKYAEIPAGPLPEDRSLRRLALTVERMDLLTQVSGCFFPAKEEESKRFQDRCQALDIWQAPPIPILQGRHLIARGIKPGKRMGEVLQKCFEAQLDGVFAGETDALQFLESLEPMSGD
ncbi:MAG: CCA tRNA nucleotidyltransferase [Lentisphaeria bacterium]|nr:CCA tRNA nucleotidyltransferase [Lentisphaeria bacterium]